MAKIMMSVPLSIEIMDKKKKKEVLKIEIRELSKSEKKEHKALADKYKNLASTLNRIQVKMDSIIKKRDYSEKLENFKDAMEYQKKSDVLTDELAELVISIDEIGGNDFLEVQAQDNFDLLVSGEGKDRLSEIAEIRGYGYVTNLLYREREKVEGKQDEE